MWKWVNWFVHISYFDVLVWRAKLEIEKQREIEIVEKILSEEKALATRKKQQPHLFLDRDKEIVKVTTLVFLLPT